PWIFGQATESNEILVEATASH
ncbi:MAG: hypothetical protein RL198_484, partial [Actinomycetota bacterium]